jgi:hypothetical protein
MHFTEQPEFLAQNPTDFEIEAVKLLADQRYPSGEPTEREALALLAEVRHTQQEIEYEALANLRKTTHSDPRGNPQVDKVYRWIILLAVIGVILYVYARVSGMR